MRIAYQCYGTGEYIGPMEIYSNVLPNGATWEAPPDEIEGHVRFYKNGRWEQVEDHRGTKYWLPNDAWNSDPREMTDFGPLPQNALLSPPEMSEKEKLDMLKKQCVQAIQIRLDEFAKERDYDDIVSLTSYCNSTSNEFKYDANRAIVLRDATWNRYYSIINDISAGKRSISSVEEVLAELPTLTWK